METRIRVRGAPGAPWWQRDATIVAAVLVLLTFGAVLGRRPAPPPLDPGNPTQRRELLRREIADLRTQQLLGQEGLRESVRLRRLQQVAEQLSGRGLAFVAATVAPTRGTRVRLGRGERSEVSHRDVVVAPDGLVGRVVSVGAYESEAALLTDPLVGVAVRIVPAQRRADTTDQTRGASQKEEAKGVGDESVRGIVTGGRSDGLLSLSYLTSDHGVSRGDRVETSGMGGVYPPELAVGVVQDEPATRPGRPAEATVKPFVEWMRLREVLVVHRPTGDDAETEGR